MYAHGREFRVPGDRSRRIYRYVYAIEDRVNTYVEFSSNFVLGKKKSNGRITNNLPRDIFPTLAISYHVVVVVVRNALYSIGTNAADRVTIGAGLWAARRLFPV